MQQFAAVRAELAGAAERAVAPPAGELTRENGPAPTILAFFLNAAIEQAVATARSDKGTLEEAFAS